MSQPTTITAKRQANDRFKPERIFNLFLLMEGEVIRGLAAKAHDVALPSHEAKNAFLRERTRADLPEARWFPLPDRYQVADVVTKEVTTGLYYDQFMLSFAMEEHLSIFRVVLDSLGASDDVVACVTPIRTKTPLSGVAFRG